MKLVVLVLVCFWFFNLSNFLDLLAHVSRYRDHLRNYPNNNRGRVWRHTK